VTAAEHNTINPDPLKANRELAVKIADVITETPASDTTVICSGENERQLRAISRMVLDELGDAGISPARVEGEPVSGWILMDFEDVIVHVFDTELRGFYNLEERWAEAHVLLSIQ
jgi:ribosome-associated protein